MSTTERVRGRTGMESGPSTPPAPEPRALASVHTLGHSQSRTQAGLSQCGPRLPRLLTA